MSKGTNTTTTQTSPNPQALGAYNALMQGAAGVVGQNPFQTYGGQFTAPINAQQYGGIGGINTYANAAQPGLNAAQLLAWNAASPIGAGQILQYQNPYTQNVIDATKAQFQNLDEQQLQAIKGNAASQGALGGDREAVAEANYLGQRGTAEAPVIAGLENQSYAQAVQTALAEQQAQAQGAYGVGSLAQAAQAAGLQGAGAQVQAGTLEQQTQQAQNDALYRQFLMQQAFPYQQMQWLAGIDTGVGSQMGGTSSTTGPAPSLLAQLGGLGMAGLGVIGGTGGFGPQGYMKTLFSKRGGAIEADDEPYPGFADGGVPVLIGQPLYGGISGIVPQAQITRGRGAPAPPSAPPSGATQMIQDAQKIASAFKGSGSRNNAPAGPLDLSVPTPGEIEPPQDLTGGMEPIRASGGIVDRLPQHNRIHVPTRSGFGLGSFISHQIPHRQEGGPTVLPDGTVDWGKVVLDPSQVPASSTPEQLQQRRIADDRALGLATLKANMAPANGANGLLGPPVTEPEPGFSTAALPFTDEGRPVGGLSATPVADRIAAGQRRPVTVQPGLGESVPFSSPQSNIWPALMAAGFGMMSSRSPFPGVAIGEGGLSGLGTYTQLGKEQRAEAMTQQKINQAADNLALHAEQVQKGFAHQTEAERLAREKLEQGRWESHPPTIWGPGYMVNRQSGEVRPLQMPTAAPTIPSSGLPREGNDSVPAGGPAPTSATPAPTSAAPTSTLPNGMVSPILSDDDARAIAKRYVTSGNRMELSNLGSGNVGSMNRAKIQHFITDEQKSQNISNEELANRQAEWEGRKAGQRALGTMETRMGVPAFELEGAIKLARGSIEKVPRTGFLPFNKLIEGFQNNTLSPEQRELAARTQGVVNTYAAVMSRGANVVTDHARGRANELLQTAFDAPTYNKVLDVLDSEKNMAVNSPQRMREFYRQHYGTGSVSEATAGGPGTPAPAGPAAPPGGAGTRPVIHSKAEYDALAPGTEFVDASGKPFKKP